MVRLIYFAALSALYFGTFVGATSAASDFPQQSVQILTDSAPGGAGDAVSRLFAAKLQEKWGQPVVVVNKPAAVGLLVAQLVAQAPHDGYTLAMVSNNFTISPGLYKLSFNPLTDFSPVTQLVQGTDVFYINPQATPGVNTLADFIKLAKSQPGKLNFGSIGPGSPPYMDMQLLMRETGMNMESISYRGGSVAVTALLGGEIQAMFGGIIGGLGSIQAGKLKALAVIGSSRSPLLPDVPTVDEAANLKGFNSSVWFGILAPPGTPKDVVDKLHDDMVSIARSPEIQSRLTSQGFVTIASSPEEFTETIRSEIALWTDLEKNLGMQKQ